MIDCECPHCKCQFKCHFVFLSQNVACPECEMVIRPEPNRDENEK